MDVSMISNTDRQLTEEQIAYITAPPTEHIKLLGFAGGAKTSTTILRIKYLIDNNHYTPNQIHMMCFSRMAKDDFINKVIRIIPEFTNITTIDALAKRVIDENNTVDVSILSGKFRNYLRDTSKKILRNHEILKDIKIIFVDEAQDLNEVQYEIIKFLKKKLKIVINLIGDPNQNIFQFRESSEKYLKKFKGKEYVLTKNFRSYDEIIEFSKYLRPHQEHDIVGVKGKAEEIPCIYVAKNSNDVEKFIIDSIKWAVETKGMKYGEIAILAPTRGYIKNGASKGLCLVTNVLHLNKIPFNCFYNEYKNDIDNSKPYHPDPDKINILTFMGSKGLEWRYVILVDANNCLIYGYNFTPERHKHDRYLLYVACSRAIEYMTIICNKSKGVNEWFREVPESAYKIQTGEKSAQEDNKLKCKPPKFGQIWLISNVAVGDFINSLSVDQNCRLIELCQYAEKEIINIYEGHNNITSDVFLGKFVENIFTIFNTNDRHAHFGVISKIIEKQTIVVDGGVYKWYQQVKNFMDWEKYDQFKKNKCIPVTIAEIIDSKFNRNIPFSDNVPIDIYIQIHYINNNIDFIKHHCNKYLKTEDENELVESIYFNTRLMCIMENQHYYQIDLLHEEFEKFYDRHHNLIRDVIEFAQTTDIKIKTQQQMVSRGYSIDNLTNKKFLPILRLMKDWIYGFIDFIDVSDEIWEIKCVNSVNFSHVLQTLLYNIMIMDKQDKYKINIINLLKGEIHKITISLNDDAFNEIDSMIKNQILYKHIMYEDEEENVDENTG